MLDRVVAVIEGQVLTQSELVFETRVALVNNGAVGAASGPIDDQTLRASLEYVIGQRLHVAEADKLQAFMVDPEDVQKAVAAFEKRIGGKLALESFLHKSDADEQMLATSLARSLRAERILDSKIRLKAQVSDADARAYYDAHQDELKGTFEDLRAVLKEKLVRDKYQTLALAEMKEVRRSGNVRVIAPFAREGGR